MLKIAGKEFSSRLIIGTGKFASNEIMEKTIIESNSEIVTVAIRRIDFDNKENNILDYIPKNIQLLPNTSGARNSEEAVRIARLARECSGVNWIKIEVINDHEYLLPDPVETLKASKTLVDDGFVVFPYINSDPVLCKKT